MLERSREQGRATTEYTDLWKAFEETTFPSIETVIDGRGSFTNAPFIKPNTTTSTHRLIDRLDAELEVTSILTTAER